MIYVKIKTYMINDISEIDYFLDFLENQLNILSENLNWPPNKAVIKFKTEDVQDISGFETYIMTMLRKPLEWEYHDEEEQERYIAYYDPKIHEQRITKIYLISFKENIDLMWNH